MILITDSIDNIATDDEKAMYNNIINKAKDHKGFFICRHLE